MKKLVAFWMVLILLGSFTACDNNKTEDIPDPLPSASVSPTPTPTPAPSPTPSPTPEPTQPPTAEDIFPREFTFMNGMRDWRVNLQIEEDGSFTGHEEARTWLPMGAEEEGAKGFTDFKGKFTMPGQVNDYTCSMKLEEFQIEPGEETVIDGVRYIPYDDYATGFDVGTEFLVYLPGAPLEELPEDFLLWVKAPMGIKDDETTLPWYGLYNVKEQLGWFEIEPFN